MNLDAVLKNCGLSEKSIKRIDEALKIKLAKAKPLNEAYIIRLEAKSPEVYDTFGNLDFSPDNFVDEELVAEFTSSENVTDKIKSQLQALGVSDAQYSISVVEPEDKEVQDYINNNTSEYTQESELENNLVDALEVNGIPEVKTRVYCDNELDFEALVYGTVTPVACNYNSFIAEYSQTKEELLAAVPALAGFKIESLDEEPEVIEPEVEEPEVTEPEVEEPEAVDEAESLSNVLAVDMPESADKLLEARKYFESAKGSYIKALRESRLEKIRENNDLTPAQVLSADRASASKIGEQNLSDKELLNMSGIIESYKGKRKMNESRVSKLTEALKLKVMKEASRVSRMKESAKVSKMREAEELADELADQVLELSNTIDVLEDQLEELAYSADVELPADEDEMLNESRLASRMRESARARASRKNESARPNRKNESVAQRIRNLRA